MGAMEQRAKAIAIAGYEAAKQGEPKDSNPYSPLDPEAFKYACWQAGWKRGAEDSTPYPYGEGHEAAVARQPLTANPHAADSQEWTEWQAGWIKGYDDMRHWQG